MIPMEGLRPDFRAWAQQVAAALAEGFCPEGHPLAEGGGRWGLCRTCGMTWTVHPESVTYRVTRGRWAGQETAVSLRTGFVYF
jgi:hypothetical protein